MGLFSRRSDRELAETKYAGRESASDRASRRRRENHRNKGAQQAADQGQAWDDRDRKRRGTSFWTW
jgi:hypothetical protein